MSSGPEFFLLGGRTVQVNWENDALRTIMRAAIAHRACPEQAPELVIEAKCEPIPVSAGVSGGLEINESADGWTVLESVRGLRSELQTSTGRAIFACREPALLPIHERAAPFRLILQGWLRTRGVHLLHAAAVSWPGKGAVLLAAPSGGGKSNTFLSCLTASPLQLLGEDFVGVDNEAVPSVWSVYNPAKLHERDLARFPFLTGAGLPRDPVDGKVLFDLGQLHPDRFADGPPLRGIFVLRVAGTEGTALVPAAAGDAARAMLTSLLMVIPSARRPLFEFVTRLSGRVPIYRLELGRDPGQVARAITDYLRS